MHEAIRSLLERHQCRTREEYLNALREILQQLALLGLWRAKFFEHAAFYGGTALRMLHGLDRYSEDLDFSLLRPMPGFSLEGYGAALRREISGFGFEPSFDRRVESRSGAIESAVLKVNAARELGRIEADESLSRGTHPGAQLRIKLEVDTDPPGGFSTQTRYVLQPIPFPVRVFSLPDLFAGKLHAVLCRRWANRVKGRDWYDMAWYAGHYPQVSLSHLEERMRRSGDWAQSAPLNLAELRRLLTSAVERLDIDAARKEALPFVRDRRAVEVWSPEFFATVIGRIDAARP